MKFSFKEAIKKAHQDLTVHRKNIFELILMFVPITLFSVGSTIIEIPKWFYFFSLLFPSMYYILMYNNIIAGKEFVLDDILRLDRENNFFVAIMKLMLVSIAYGIIFISIFLLCSIPVLVLVKTVNLNMNLALNVVLGILFAISAVYIMLACLVFSETMEIKDAFNLKKMLKTLKLAGKNYLAYILIFVAILLVSLLINVGLILGLNTIFNFVPNFDMQNVQIISKTITAVVMSVLNIFVGYYTNNILAQIYTQSMKEPEIEVIQE